MNDIYDDCNIIYIPHLLIITQDNIRAVCKANKKIIPHFARASLFVESEQRVNVVESGTTEESLLIPNLPSFPVIPSHNMFHLEKIPSSYSYIQMTRKAYDEKMRHLSSLYGGAVCVTSYDDWLERCKEVSPSGQIGSYVYITFENREGFQKSATTSEWFHEKAPWVTDYSQNHYEYEDHSINRLMEIMSATGVVVKCDLEWIEDGISDAAYKVTNRTDETYLGIQYTSQLLDGPQGRCVRGAKKTKGEIEEILRRRMILIDDIYYRDINNNLYHCGCLFIPPTLETYQYISQLEDFTRLWVDPFTQNAFSRFCHLWFSPRGTNVADPTTHPPTLALKEQISTCLARAIGELEALDELRRPPEYFIGFSTVAKRAERNYLNFFENSIEGVARRKIRCPDGDMILIEELEDGKEQEHPVEFKGKKSDGQRGSWAFQGEKKGKYDSNKIAAYALVVYDIETLLPIRYSFHPTRTMSGENNLRDPNCATLCISTAFIDKTCVTVDVRDPEDWENLHEKLFEFGNRPKK
jgi:hypothetical protein